MLLQIMKELAVDIVTFRTLKMISLSLAYQNIVTFIEGHIEYIFVKPVILTSMIYGS